MPSAGTRTLTTEARILAALRIAARRGLGGLTVAELHTQPGLTSRRSAGDRRGGGATGRQWRRGAGVASRAVRRRAVDLPAG